MTALRCLGHFLTKARKDKMKSSLEIVDIPFIFKKVEVSIINFWILIKFF